MELFDRVKIGSVTLSNRIGLAPMGMRTSDGSFQKNTIEYYRRVARGGSGLLITGATFATTEFEPRSNYVLEDFQQICALSTCAEQVHYEGSKLFLQISPGLGRLGHKDPAQPPHAPSDVEARFFPGVKCIPFTIDEIKQLIAQMARAARYAQIAGCDGCEIHAYGGYLIDQFLTAEWNKRTDKYGGDLSGRITFLLEIIDAIRTAVGNQFPIIVKVTVDHCMPEKPTMRKLEEGLELCRLLKKHGKIDGLHADCGCYERYYYQIPTVYEPDGLNIEIYKQVKAVMGEIPVLGHGKLNNPEVARQAITEKAVDIVLLGHQLIADPNWPAKVKSGDLRNINHCIGCNECLYTGFHGKHRTCSINPLSGRETDFIVRKTKKPQKILVIGGGPAGIEAALMGDWMGHEMTLWEKTDTLGGNLIAAGAPAFKKDVRIFLDNIIYRLKRSSVKILMNKLATADEVISGAWDVVILANGSDVSMPMIPGIDANHVCTAIEALSTTPALVGQVAVIGGGLVGCETALHISQTADKVYCIEASDDILKTANHLFNNDQSLRNLISQSPVEIHLSTKVKEITAQGLTCECGDSTYYIDCDNVVIATGFKTNHELEDQLFGKVKQLRVIGDAVTPRKIFDAINEGLHNIRVLY